MFVVLYVCLLGTNCNAVSLDFILCKIPPVEKWFIGFVLLLQTVSAEDRGISTVFEIIRPTTIPSDSSEHRVTIAVVDLQPKLLHVTVPCKESNVYLLASLKNETEYPFLAGQAAIYFENSFVAKVCFSGFCY